MRAMDIARFQFGSAEAIRAVARSRAALPTGIVLVLLTAAARSSDQTWIGENPLAWLLAFSLVSGTWLFMATYLGLVRSWWAPEHRDRSPWRDWPGFMGLFWMTSPVAWLYAIPVERFLDSLPAAKANLALLGIVSLWRVLLFGRVIQVMAGVRHYGMAVAWVLLPAAVEAVVVTFFTSFGEAVARGMGGLRNSPEEDLILQTLSAVTMLGFWASVGLLLLVLLWKHNQPTDRLPVRETQPMPRRGLLVCAVFWIAVTLVNQPSVYRVARVEADVLAGRFREALDRLARHEPQDFAPSRPLPPKAYEYATLPQLAGLLEASRAGDPAWVQEHLLRRLDDWIDGLVPSWDRPLPLADPRARSEARRWALQRSRPPLESILQVLRWVGRPDNAAGRAWFDRHRAFWTVAEDWVEQAGKGPVDEARALFRTLLPASTNAPAARPGVDAASGAGPATP